MCFEIPTYACMSRKEPIMSNDLLSARGRRLAKDRDGHGQYRSGRDPAVCEERFLPERPVFIVRRVSPPGRNGKPAEPGPRLVQGAFGLVARSCLP
jgi:hypothetical protein